MFKFSNWIKLTDINKLDKLPGVYIITYSDTNISGKPFNWESQIIYIGMTNSCGGLKQRLKQFDNTLREKANNHSGAKKIRYKYKNNVPIKKLYISTKSFKWDVLSNQVKDLLIMGSVAQFEYKCFAEYVKKYNGWPEFNDKKHSPKK